MTPLRFDAGPPDSPVDEVEVDESELDRCPGCDEPIDTGCPRDCPERALDDDADAYVEQGRP